MLLPFINKSAARNVYVERFIKNDYSDFRVDIVDGEFVACYGRKASGRDWRTNITDDDLFSIGTFFRFLTVWRLTAGAQ